MFTDQLASVSGTHVRTDVPLSSLTTFHIGGPARVVCDVMTPDAASRVFDLLHQEKIPFAFLGRGSNTLCADAGYSGVVLHASDEELYLLDDRRIYAGAAVPLPKLAAFARDHGLDGLSFAQGIPGCVGGGLCMNAGAYGGSLGAVTESVTAVWPDGRIAVISGDACDFGYRQSIFRSEGCMALSAVFRLVPGDREQIAADMRTYAEKRASTQPLEFYSAGSVFKRPEGYFAGKLIEDCGLKGYSIGGAQVSEKHAGFIISKGEATAVDVTALIAHIQQCVLERFGVSLEREICLLGDF